MRGTDAASESCPHFSIVVPCYNEAENIPILLDRFGKFAGRGDFELILVNNGSTDDSAELLERALTEEGNGFVRVVTIPRNIGYGHGIHMGLLRARGEILAYSHADIQTPPEDVFRAFDMIVAGQAKPTAHLIKGFRINRSDEATFFTRSLSRVVRLALGVRLDDINGQPKVFDRAFLRQLVNPPTDFSYDVYVLYRAVVEGRKLVTFDVDFGERLHGESKWSTSLVRRCRTILGYILSIVRMAWHHRGDNNNPVGRLLRFLARRSWRTW